MPTDDPTPDAGLADCPCLALGPRHPDFDEAEVGADARFGVSAVHTCRLCGRRWLHYHVEDEAFGQSGRWYCGLLTPDLEARLTADTAADVLRAMPWHAYGGSYYGHAGQRGVGPIV